MNHIRPQTKTIWTIGHSIHSLDKFITMLKSFRIELVVDIRSVPNSGKCFHFNKEALQFSLPDNNLRYIHIKELGGWKKDGTDAANTTWRDVSFSGYANYMQENTFKEAVKHLEFISTGKRTVVMCSEAFWGRCHRSLVADYFKVNGWKVKHILNVGVDEIHPFTTQARIIGNRLFYSKE